MHARVDWGRKGTAMNILIIDDEASLRRTLRIALESMGHQVADAPGGGRASGPGAWRWG